jgi:hypothetical protein
MEPDYSHYSLQALLEVHDSIDRELYPERYTRVCAEIEKKQDDPVEVALLEEDTLYDKIIFVRVILFLCGLFACSRLYTAWSEGVISWKGEKEYYLNQQPNGFYILVAFHIGMVLFSLYMVISDRWIKKSNV